MRRYAELFARARGLVLLFVILVTGAAFAGLARLEFDDVPRNLFAGEDAEFARLLSVYEDFGVDDADVLLLLEGPVWTDPLPLELLGDAARRVGAVEGVVEVLWAGAFPLLDDGRLMGGLPAVAAEDPERAARLAREHPLIGERLLSADGRTALLVARLPEDAIAIGDITGPVDELRALVEELARDLEPGGARVGLTGIPPIRVDIYRTVRRDQVRFFLIGAVLCILVALALFRSVQAVLATTVPPLFGALWAYGAIGFLGVELDILSGVLSMLVIVIALTDSVHLMIDVRLSRAAGLGRREAAVEAIRHLGMPCALTSLTTAIGFGSLGIGSVPAIRQFGLLASLSVFLAFLAVLTVLPLLASSFEHVGARRERGADPWGRLARPVARALFARPAAVALTGIALTAGLFWLARGLEPENRLTEALPHDEAYHTLEALERAFGGVLPSYVLVEWDAPLEASSPEVLEALAGVSAGLEGIEPLGRPLSVLDLAAAVPGGRERPALALALIPEEARRRFLRPELGRALVLAPVPDGGTDEMGELFGRIEEVMASQRARHPELRFHLTGTDHVARANVNRMIDDLARSLAFAVLVIFVVIAVEYRSLRIGLVSLLPNLFPLVLVGGVLRLIDRPLQMATAVLFTVLLGLAVDDTIHFLSRYRRERELGGEGDPLERAFLAVGRAIAVTTIVLVVGFGTVGLSDVPTNRAFAALSALGLVGALVGDLFFLPALLALTRRRQARP